MPRSIALRALLGAAIVGLILALLISPFADARPKDKQNDKRGDVASETTPPPASDSGVAVEVATNPEQSLPVQESAGASNDKTLISSDADGDYIPDAMDNCPYAQNPDQADADGDGIGDACRVYQDSDGDGTPDKSDNCPNIATSDFSDRDGDGVGDSCDKSPDGVEPEPEPAPDLNGRGGEGAPEETTPVNGEGQDGTSIERSSRPRSKQRDRTDVAKPSITVGNDGQDQVEEPADPEPQNDETPRDNPRINEELIAEAAASGELYAPPEPPPAPQREWDGEAAASNEPQWNSIIRIDAGATDESQPISPVDPEPGDANTRAENRGASGEGDVADSQFARGWVRAKLILQQEADSEPGDGEPPTADESRDGADAPAPVPVESGLIIKGVEPSEPGKDSEANIRGAKDGDKAKERAKGDSSQNSDANRDRENGDSGKDGSRRDGSGRGPAAPERDTSSRTSNSDQKSDRETKDRKSRGNRHRPEGWSDDQYFTGGSALNWSADIDIDGTDDDGLYLTQRSGSGQGKKRGFSYTIPLEESGTYLVRLYFAEPFWGAPGGPDGASGKRVFSVTAEGDTVIRDLDIYDEVGSSTALVKETEVEVADGELNLRFTASAGEPIVAAIEVLAPAN
ncbi:MAG: malectin domain-containing carbohydrate-binding protein [Thermomicrobiales bacterium]